MTKKNWISLMRTLIKKVIIKHLEQNRQKLKNMKLFRREKKSHKRLTKMVSKTIISLSEFYHII